MKLATLATGGDGTLVLVSRDGRRAARAEAASTLQAALEDWGSIAPRLKVEQLAVESGDAEGLFTLEPERLGAVLPRSFQFLDASAFLAHNHILAKAWGFPKRAEDDPVLMYQGISDRYFGPADPVPFRSEDDQIDFEGEFGIVTDRVPMGVSPAEAMDHVKLIVLINDWSLRAFGPSEMRGGFGFIHAKPPSTLSAFAITPDELGPSWRNGRIDLPLVIHRGDTRFGRPGGGAMHFGFHELIAHAAATRDLCAGTVIGSGTVSNFEAAEVGSACIAERRALDALAQSEATPFLSFGERVTMEVFDDAGVSLLGRLDQRIVRRD